MKYKDQIVQNIDCYSFHQLKKDLKKIKAMYPFVKLNVIGKSHLQKEIFELKIGEGKRKIHINASFHGNEWITTIVLMRYIEKYVSSISNIKSDNYSLFKKIYKKTTISFVPMVNPDGVDLVLLGLDAAENYKNRVIIQNYNQSLTNFDEWKANINGVDLNKQFPAKWHYEANRKPKQKNYRDHPGQKPLTEPEAKALVHLVKNSRFDRLIALHTQGEEIYWYYDDEIQVKNAEKHAKKLAKVSNYKAVKYLDNFAGFKDWFISFFQKEGYTIELGKGKNPLSLKKLNKIQNECDAILTTAALLKVEE